MSPTQIYMIQCEDSGHEPDATILAALHLAQTVEVLNAWVSERSARGYLVSDQGCVLWGTADDAKHLGKTPAAAIAAAAKAVEEGRS